MKHHVLQYLSMYARFVLYTLIITTIFACQREEFTTELTQQVDYTNQVLKPVEMQHGMLAFASKENLDLRLIELNRLSFEEFKEWEKNLGIETQRGAFDRVAQAEEAISDYYESLPVEKQKIYRKMPVVHSELYKEMLDRKIITIVKDADGSEYWDYAVSDPSLANVLNMNGFVKIGDWICQYTPEGFKIILDGDFNKIEQLQTITKNYKDDTFLVHFKKEDEQRTKAISHSWGNDTGFDICCNNKKRWKVLVTGSSEPLYGEIEDDCTNFLSCVNQVKAQAQKRNFWGQFVFTLSFTPSLSFTNTWSYDYTRYTDGLCGLNKQSFYSVGSYSCTVNPCPTSPHTASYPTVNNGTFNMTPHGNWSASAPLWPSGYGYFGDAFDVSGTLNETYHGTSHSLSY